MKYDVLVDLQFGSTGKGLLAGYLGVENEYEIAISANMPNAGHTAYSPGPSKKMFVHKVLPSAIFGKELRILAIGPGAVFDIDRLEAEWKAVCEYRSGLLLVIHETAALLTNLHREIEARTLSGISSTMQGSAAAMVDRIMRRSGAIVKDHYDPIMARLVKYGSVVIVNHTKWLDIITTGGDALVEGSQGYSLGISAGFYPYCTSRDCTPARVIADCGLPVKKLGKVYGVARVHPIRVGNTPDGHSGDWYPDQQELTFASLGVPEELTTVTQRVRRIASFSEMQIAEAMQMAMPDEIFLNFCQYDERAALGAVQAINRQAGKLGCSRVTFTGWGALSSDIVEEGQ